MLLVARFVPGGRTATTFTRGALGLGWRRFLAVDAAAAAIWSAYAAAVGAIGGEAFGESFGRALILALVSASALAVIGELVHRRRRPRGRDVPAEPDGICLGSSGANPSPPARGLISRQAPQRARNLQ